jgi:hypothetical protein
MAVFELTPKEIRTEVIHQLKAGNVPFIRSSPGLGKSAIIRQIAEDFGLELIDIRASSCLPEDINGLPFRTEDNKAKFMPFDMFPAEGDPLPAGKNGWLLFLDEINAAPKSLMPVFYKLVLDRYAGQTKLHESVFIVAAGNKDTDNAIVNDMGTAMNSRLTHYFMRADLESFMDFAVKAQIDHRILGFLEFKPNYLHDFDPNREMENEIPTFACSRTWEMLSKRIKDIPSNDIPRYTAPGIVGMGAGVEFTTFIQEYDNLPKYRDIIAKPSSAPVPVNPATRYALVTMLLDQTKKDDLDEVFEYIYRLSTEFQAVFFKGLMRRDPSIRRNPTFIKNTNKIIQFISDTSLEAA